MMGTMSSFVIAMLCFLGTVRMQGVNNGSAPLNVQLNSTAVLPCQTKLASAVDWWYQSSPTSQGSQVCINGEIGASFKDRFSIRSADQGHYDLVIQRVRVTDSGLYTCIEDAGLGPGQFKRMLTVHDSNADQSTSSSKDDETTRSSSTVGAAVSATSNIAIIIIAVSSVAAAVFVVAVVVIVLFDVKQRKHRSASADSRHENISLLTNPFASWRVIKKARKAKWQSRLSHHKYTQQIQSESADHEIPLIRCLPAESRHTIFVKSLVLLCSNGTKLVNAAFSLGGVSAAWVEDIKHAAQKLDKNRLRKAIRSVKLGRWNAKYLRTVGCKKHAQRKFHVPTVLCLPTEVMSAIVMEMCLSFMKETLTPEVQTIVAMCSLTADWWREMNEPNKKSLVRRLLSITEYACWPYRRLPKRIVSLEMKKKVLALTPLDKNIYFLCDSSKGIGVVDCSRLPCKLAANVNVNISKMIDIAAMRVNSNTFLFVATGSDIWQIDPKGASVTTVSQVLSKTLKVEPKVPKKLIINDVNPLSLSVAGELGLLAVMTADHELRFYSGIGSLIKSVVLPKLVNPCYTKVIPSGETIITCSAANGSAIQQPRRKIVNGIDVHTAVSEFSVSFDPEGRAFWSDGYGVYLLHPDLTRCRMLMGFELVQRQDLVEPRKLCYLDSRGLMVVCQRNAIDVHIVRKPAL